MCFFRLLQSLYNVKILNVKCKYFEVCCANEANMYISEKLDYMYQQCLPALCQNLHHPLGLSVWPRIIRLFGYSLSLPEVKLIF